MWFAKKEKFFSLSVGIYSNPLGAGLSYIFSAWIVRTEDSSDKVLELLFIYSIITTFPFLMFCVFCKKKEKENNNESSDFAKSMKNLLKDKKYMFSMFFFAFSMKILIIIITLFISLI